MSSFSRASLQRHRVAIVLTSLVLLVAGGGTALGALGTSRPPEPSGKVAVAPGLPIPPLAKSTVENGVRTFRLDLRRGRAGFGHAFTASTFYGQDATAGAAPNSLNYLAPTLRAARGERIRIEVKNDLGAVSSLHWHGMHLPAKMDGGPHQPIAPGATWAPSWQIRQPAATLWYHPHPHGATERQVANGLAGLFMLDDPAAPAAKALPHTYGVDDVPVVLQDKSFDASGSAITRRAPHENTGNLGRHVLVNGAADASFTAATRLVRLRIVNASTARIYNLGFTDGRAFQVIAGDGGLLDAPKNTKRVVLSPGDRLEIVVAISPDDNTMLRDYPVQLASGANQRHAGGNDTLDVLRLRGTGRLGHSATVPRHLADLPAADVSPNVKHRSFSLTMPTINNKEMDMTRIDFKVVAGTTELWTVRNTDDMPHNFHVHDVQYRVLSLDGKQPPLEMQGRQDTVLVKPGETARLLIAFSDDYADATTPYMFHCHLLLHEDVGMMGQFVIVRAGQRPARAVGAGALPAPSRR